MDEKKMVSDWNAGIANVFSKPENQISASEWAEFEKESGSYAIPF